MNTFFIIYLVFAYIILGFVTLIMYRAELENDKYIRYLNKDNAKNIRIYFRLVALVLWPVLWVLLILKFIFISIPAFFKAIFGGIYKMIVE